VAADGDEAALSPVQRAAWILRPRADATAIDGSAWTFTYIRSSDYMPEKSRQLAFGLFRYGADATYLE
jgi:hypothetical protein